MNAPQIVASYLVLQATGTAAWWILLLLMPPSVEWFKPASWPPASLLGFWLADSLLLIAGSLTAATAVLGEKSWAAIAVWAVAAAVWYPALYCIGVSIITDEAWTASAMMVSMAGLTLAMATIYGNSTQTPASIRVTPMTTKTAVGWTIVQTLTFWSIFLWILPKGIIELEHRAGWQSISHAYQGLGSACLFIGASTLGLLSGMTMAARGNGTPLPTATAPKLVVAGPYRLVRNPMALAGVVQGVAAGWFFGSPGVIGYSLAGAIVWHLFVRPVEEADLQARFGDTYARYRASVGLWLPRLMPVALPQ